MSEEEKEGYEELKKQYRLSTNVDCITTDIRNEYARTILNLIEKQQKEIEDLKELMAHKNGYTKQLEEDLFENAGNYVVSKDKIREKIEELENEREQLRIDKKVTWDSQIYKIDLKISAYRELLKEE